MKSKLFTLPELKQVWRKTLFLIGWLLVGVAQTLTAQNNFTFSGLVQAENGDPLPGVNVVEKGTTNGTITDLTGAFQVNANSGMVTFTFSMVGYETIEKAMKAGAMETIILKEK